MFLFKQDNGVSTEDYIRHFKSYWDMCEAYKAAAAFHPLLIKEKLTGNDTTPGVPTTDELDKAELAIKEELMAGLLISSANQKRFGLL